MRHHGLTLCHTDLFVEPCQATTNSLVFTRKICPLWVRGTSADLLLSLVTVSIKLPSLMCHVPAIWYVFVRSGWLNIACPVKLPSGATMFVHRIFSSSRDQAPAKLWRNSLSSLSLEILTCRQSSNIHAMTITPDNPITVSFFMARNDA